MTRTTYCAFLLLTRGIDSRYIAFHLRKIRTNLLKLKPKTSSSKPAFCKCVKLSKKLKYNLAVFKRRLRKGEQNEYSL